MCVIREFSCEHTSKVECQNSKTRLITQPDMETASAIGDVEDDPFVDTNTKTPATNTKDIKDQRPTRGHFSSSPLPPPKFLLSPTKSGVEADHIAANLHDISCGLGIKKEKIKSECHDCMLMRAREEPTVLEDERRAAEKLREEVKQHEDVNGRAQNGRKQATSGTGTAGTAGTAGTDGGIPVWAAGHENPPRGIAPDMPPANNIQARNTPHSYPAYLPNVYYDNTNTTTTVHQSTGVYHATRSATTPMYNPMISGVGPYNHVHQPMLAPRPQHAYPVPILQYGTPAAETYPQFFNTQMAMLEMEMETETSMQYQVQVQDVYEQYGHPQMDAQEFWYLPRM
ncbi:hypothetical protein GJ744_010291 [Endocarpon pusillum]|uniref:Uncharacterized protein n=1 Tax=Endocarpon pusillum TaxID=364733 RepID=A0A8H7AID9_9EURO|nr:hypothetical protein GJ744_010291 [Endocarpon pusillum]